MKAVIIGSGSVSNYGYIKKAALADSADVIICCDGGAIHAKPLGVVPDIIVGDMDSIDAETLKYYEETGVPFEKYPAAKDMTDTEIALEKAIASGAEEIAFIGVTGDRADHTLANIGLLYECLKRGINGIIFDDNNRISLIDKKTSINEAPGQTISLLPFAGEASGITTEGLLYPLKNENLKLGTARGVSNVCVNGSGFVDLKMGMLLLIAPIRL